MVLTASAARSLGRAQGGRAPVVMVGRVVARRIAAGRGVTVAVVTSTGNAVQVVELVRPAQMLAGITQTGPQMTHASSGSATMTGV